jgi:CheY-like chemotaxis protein
MAARSSGSETDRVASAAPRLLLVDDEASVRKTARAVLEQARFEVREAASGREAWQALGSWQPDLVILDAMLPDIHGFALVREMRAQGLTVPVIAISAYYRGGGYADDVRESCGVTAYLEKPFRMSDLVALVERSLVAPAGGPPLTDAALSSGATMLLRTGVDAFGRRDLAASASALRGALELEPTSAIVAGWLGVVYATGGRHLEALPLLERAAAADGASWQNLRNLALACERAGFRRKALEAWARTLAAAPAGPPREEARERLAAG